mmetsp:Transcript_4048/g.9870  ORF Transcript_4048/g.9870 Transcript_4048/m.9870 type:complete len:329 (+) Transcript_4048:348-1334(+)
MHVFNTTAARCTVMRDLLNDLLSGVFGRGYGAITSVAGVVVSLLIAEVLRLKVGQRCEVFELHVSAENAIQKFARRFHFKIPIIYRVSVPLARLDRHELWHIFSREPECSDEITLGVGVHKNEVKRVVAVLFGNVHHLDVLLEFVTRGGIHHRNDADPLAAAKTVGVDVVLTQCLVLGIGCLARHAGLGKRRDLELVILPDTSLALVHKSLGGFDVSARLRTQLFRGDERVVTLVAFFGLHVHHGGEFRDPEVAGHAGLVLVLCVCEDDVALLSIFVFHCHGSEPARHGLLPFSEQDHLGRFFEVHERIRVGVCQPLGQFVLTATLDT